MLRRDLWDRGLMTEVTEAIVGFGFDFGHEAEARADRAGLTA